MKKTVVFMIEIAVVVALIIWLYAVNKPYKPLSFVVDGEMFTATVENGGEMILTLFSTEKHKDWEITLSPSELFASDYFSETENGMEFHIIALSEGKGEMAFQCRKDDGTIGKYILELSISRHKKIYLQIDAVAFRDYESGLRG